jgi:hypothetical protein
MLLDESRDILGDLKSVLHLDCVAKNVIFVRMSPVHPTSKSKNALRTFKLLELVELVGDVADIDFEALSQSSK